MAERVGRALDASLLGIQLNQLLYSSGAELPATAGLEQPAVLGVGGDVGSQGGGERLAEQDVPILAALSPD